MTTASRPGRRWGAALAAALAAHALVAAGLWPRGPHALDGGAAPAAILIELQPPSAAATAAAAESTPQPAVEPARTASPTPAPTSQREATPPVRVPPQAAPLDAPEPVASEPIASAPAAAAPASPPETSPAASAAAAPAMADPSARVASAPRHGSTQARTSAELTWQSQLLGHLERFRRYPARALRQRHEGVTHLRFSVDRNGGVRAVRLERSSGSDLLDDEALDVVRRAQPLPPPPPEIEGEPVEVVVPVQFRLRRR